MLDVPSAPGTRGEQWLRYGCTLVCISFSIAAIAMLLHALGVNRQYDTQISSFALEFLKSVREHRLASFLLEPRKYPLVGILLFALTYLLTLGSLLAAGRIAGIAALPAYFFGHPVALTLVGRSVTLLAAIGTLALVAAISRRLFPRVSPLCAVALLLSSILFSVYATAIRPHMLETFCTLLTFFLSLRLVERKTWRTAAVAFASAVLAVTVLQNGFFAFLFPVFAFATEAGRFQWRRLFQWRLLTLLFCYAIAALLVGYLFLLNVHRWRSGELGIGMGNTDFNDDSWRSGRGFLQLGYLLFGSDILLTLFLLLGFFRLARGTDALFPLSGALGLYTVSYLLFFGLNQEGAMRMFLTLLPFAALVGARAFSRIKWLALLTLLITLLIHAQLFRLAVRPDTYDLAKQFLERQTRGAIATSLPWYFLDIPPTRASLNRPVSQHERYLASLPHDLPGARPYLPPSQTDRAQVFVAFDWTAPVPDHSWQQCAHIVSAPWPEQMFLWVEDIGAFYWIWRTHTLGPGILVYCRAGALIGG